LVAPKWRKYDRRIGRDRFGIAMIRAFRGAGLSALIALGLFAPLIGLVTENGDSGLGLWWAWSFSAAC
jgi:hypothetical protein